MFNQLWVISMFLSTVVTCEVLIIFITVMIDVIKPLGDQMIFLDMLSELFLGLEMVITFMAAK